MGNVILLPSARKTLVIEYDGIRTRLRMEPALTAREQAVFMHFDTPREARQQADRLTRVLSDLYHRVDDRTYGGGHG